MEVLLQYKDLIAIGLAAIIEIVIFLVFKKRPEVVDNSFVVHLCQWIDIAEHKFKNGEDKMQFVLDESKNYLGEKFIKDDVKNMVEYLLTLPEKKGKK